MLYTWQFFMFIAVISDAVGSLFQKVAFKDTKLEPLAFMIVFQVIAGIGVGIFGLITGVHAFPSVEVWFGQGLWLRNILSGTFFAGGGIAMFQSLKLIEASEFRIIFSLRILVTVILSWIFLGEGLSVSQVIGGLILFIGVLLVSTPDIRQLFRLDKGNLYAVLAGVGFGLGFANEKYVFAWFSVTSLLTVGFLLPGLLVAAAKPQAVKQIVSITSKKTWFNMLLFTVLFVINALTFWQAIGLSDNISLISSVNQVTTVVIVVLAIVFLKERQNLKRKLIATALSVFGLLLMI